jgi:c-di-GMP-binding flagellar brake protein YcgR
VDDDCHDADAPEVGDGRPAPPRRELAMIMPYLARDRRRHLRVTCAKPVRLRCGVTGKCLEGQTLDVSHGGCLLRLQGALAIKPGQAVRVAIARRQLRSLMLADDMVEATVMRRLGHDDAQHIAVSFENTTALAQAG